MKITIKSFIKSVKFIIAAFYFLFLLVSKRGCRRVVLNYHSMRKNEIEGFQKQMDYLHKYCHVVKPTEIKSAYIDTHKNVIAITFDDGFLSVKDNALPILHKYGFSAGIFVTTGYLGEKPGWNISDNSPDNMEIVINEDQIQEIYNDGFEVHSHAVTHPKLTDINDQYLFAELRDARETLENILKIKVECISYPHGAFNKRVYDFSKIAGYTIGFTIEPEIVTVSTDDLMIGRTSVSPDDNFLNFKLKVSGAYEVFTFIKKLKKKLYK